MTENTHHYDPLDHEPLPEGEEEAPPFVRTMSIVRWTLLVGMSVFAVVMMLTYFGLAPWASEGAGGVQYHCPMHPTYISSQPGDCPICGMSLVPIDQPGEMAPTTATDTLPKPKPGQWICTMCPEVISDTAGRCPVCNMFLTQVPEPKMVYTCPMHPEVVSDKPGECPKCGMDLVQSESMTEHAGHDAGMGSAPVPGLVPVTIEAKRLQLIGIRTDTVRTRPVSGDVRLTGFVTPDETRVANLQLRLSGWVSNLHVSRTGQPVETGELLLTVYSPDLYQAQQDFIVARDASRAPGDSAVAALRGQLFQSARERLRLLGLPEQDIAKLETSDLPSEIMPLRSPFTGYVLEKSVNEGQYVTPDQTLFRVADLSRVWVIADVYERNLPDIRSGQNVRLTFEAFPGEPFNGTIGYIYPSVSEVTRTLKVRIELDNPGTRLRPGMYADVSVARAGDAMLAVPADALMDGGETRYVFVVHEGTHFEPRLVSTGRRTDDWIEITGGLRSGETVVTSANFLIDSESRLQAAISGMGGAPAESHDH
ncbi:MAG: efflux RND transporter periplasmic adaptor subunit [Candidatus Zixiibacteriota bacterium]